MLTKHTQFYWYDPESQDTNVSLGCELCAEHDQSSKKRFKWTVYNTWLTWLSNYHFRGKIVLELTSDAHFIHLPVLLIPCLSGDVISEANGAERNEAEVEGIQEVPVVLQRREDGSWDEEEEADGQKAEHHGMDDAHHRLRQAPLSVDVGDRPPRAKHHYPLHGGGEEEEGEGDANRRVDDAEGLSAIGQGYRVTVSCRNDNHN